MDRELIITLVIAAFVALTMYACCVAAGNADRKTENMEIRGRDEERRRDQ